MKALPYVSPLFGAIQLAKGAGGKPARPMPGPTPGYDVPTPGVQVPTPSQGATPPMFPSY